ncbi:hypothetical protein B0H11DRAFT_2358206 [Mycena galericulata]|nr:hypothetical protein B0H11DRAFT_2358206 [Mycena galericulata]
MTITWESVPADPTVFNIELVAVANGEGAQEIANEIPTQGGGLTMGFDPLALPPPGEYSLQFVNVENVGQIYAESTIEILASSTGTSSPPATSSPPTSSPPPGSTRPTSSSPGTASSPPATGTSLSRSPAAKHDRNAHAITGGVVGAIVGGVVGAIAAIMIVLLGWWYLPRRRRASQRFRGTEAPRFLAAPVSTSLAGTPAARAHSGPDNREFQPWEGSEATAPSASTKPLPLVPPTAPAGDLGSSDVKNPIVLRWDPPSAPAPQPESTPAPHQVQPELPSRVEELADEGRDADFPMIHFEGGGSENSWISLSRSIWVSEYVYGQDADFPLNHIDPSHSGGMDVSLIKMLSPNGVCYGYYHSSLDDLSNSPFASNIK